MRRRRRLSGADADGFRRRAKPGENERASVPDEMVADEARELISGRPVPVPLRIVLSVEERRDVASRLKMEGVTVARLAELLGPAAQTIYRDVDVNPRPPRHGKNSMLEAGLVWHARHKWLPTSQDWNSSLARNKTGIRSRAGAFERWAAGYHPVADPSVWMPWPYHRQVTRVWKTFPAYRSELDERIQDGIESNDPYVQVPWDPACAWATWLPDEMRANTDSLTYQCEAFCSLLMLADLPAIAERVHNDIIGAT